MKRLPQLAIALLGSLSAGAQNPPALTGITIFDTNQGGNWTGFFGGSFNNTRGGDQANNLYLINGSVLNGPFVNHGNGPGADINIPLMNGTYTFTFFAGGGDDVGSFGMNLFFNGNGNNPGISVSAPLNSTTLAADSLSTMSLFQAAVPGAGTKVFMFGSTKVTLTAYVFHSFGFFNIDRVGAYNDAPDGQPDHIGQFTIEVNAGCQVNATSWKQNTPWGADAYDNSYISTTRYATNHSTMVSFSGGRMELQNGFISYSLSLTGAQNSVLGVTTAVNNLNAGVHATYDIDKSTGTYYLSLYNTSCEASSCFPRPFHLLHLCDGSCLSGPDIMTPKSMAAKGCGVTVMAMALSAVGVTTIPDVLLGARPLDPSVLNDFMSDTSDSPSMGGRYDNVGDVDWDNTPGRFTTGSKPLQFDSTVMLDDALCNQHIPVVAAVTSVHGKHFVLVTGKNNSAPPDGSQYSILDPGYSTTTLKDYGNVYSIRGAVKDPPDLSQFNVQSGPEADVLVVDSNGRRTGFDPTAGVIFKDIPASGYARDQIDDDDGGNTSTGITHSVQVLKPVQGSYYIVATGTQLALYTVTIHAYSQNGMVPPAIPLRGLTGPGSTAVFQLQYSPSVGASANAVRIASFPSTLDDIGNSLQLALIDNAGIANSLSEKIQAAQKAAGPAKTDILRAFENEVNAQAGKHVTGIAVDVLLQDADSLINQIP